MSIVDVGRGDCILIRAGTSSVLIDTGYAETSDAVVAFLRAKGVGAIDHLLITHYDRDHVGGLRAVGRAFGVAHVWLPNYVGGDKQYRSVVSAVDELGLPARAVEGRTVLPVGKATLTVHPTALAYVPDAKGDEGNDNDLSLVVELAHGKDSYLFAGDLEEDGIDAFLRAGLGRFDVLKVPHHGERSGSTDDLIAAVSPRLAVITDGAKDPADKKTLKLLQQAGADTYRTSRQGTIVVRSDGSGTYEVETGA